MEAFICERKVKFSLFYGLEKMVIRREYGSKIVLILKICVRYSKIVVL